MDPFLAQSLFSGSQHDNTRSSLRNPDDFFPERDIPGPDPVARWVVNAATVSTEWLGERSAMIRHGWRQMLAGWVLMLRRFARGTR